MAVTIDYAKRRIAMTAKPGFSGPVISRDVAERIRSDPRLASYDFVMDVRESDTGSTLADFQIVLSAYNEARREPGLKYGCFVSRNPSYAFWAKAMSDLFGDRACPVFMSAQAAHNFIDRERGCVPA